MGRTLTFQKVQPLTDPTYEDLNYIGRCVHIDDVKETVQKGYLVPQLLSNSKKKLKRKVLWFAPCQSMSTHNYFGNATFVVKWETVLEKLGPNLYLIDQANYNSRSYTRIVLTSTNYDRRHRKVDLTSDDSALTRSETGFQHVTNCLNKERFGLHELQIAIEVNEKDARWLLRKCKLLANDHSHANAPYSGEVPRTDNGSAFESYKCFKFNTAQNKECEYAFSEEESEKRVKAIISKKIKRMSPGSPTTPEEPLKATFKRLTTLMKEQQKLNKPILRMKAKTTSSGSPSVTTVDACAASLERLCLETRAKPSRHPRRARS